MNKSIRTVNILGAGNVAFHLTKAFVNNGIQVKQIYNRTLKKAAKIGEANNVSYTDKISELEKSDLFVIASADAAIEELSLHIPFKDTIVVHTSGSMPMSTLKGDYQKGVFYPLQTFTKDRTLDYSDIPFFIETEYPENEKSLLDFAKKVSKNVELIDSEQRAQLHMAAVWSCNFVNHMYQIGEQIVTKAGLPFDYLKPLITETAEKVLEMSPYKAQTGPAKRADKLIIEKHLQLLQNDQMHDLYERISASISNTHQHEL